MLCLTLAEMNSTAGIGPVAAVGVGVTLLAMITLLPALLVIFGRWVFWPMRPTFGSTEPTSDRLLGKRRRLDRTPPAQGMDRSPRLCSEPLPWAC